MEAEGVRKTTIMRTYISRTGHWSKVGWVRKDVYNMCCRVKRKMIMKGDARTAIEIMTARKQKDPDFYFDYRIDDKGCLKSMFWCDGQ